MFFYDRREAGIKVAEKLVEFCGRKDAVVLGLARGGVVVAAEIAKRLKVQLDLVLVRKIGAPENPEYAIGAICEDGEGIFNDAEIKNLSIPQEYLNEKIEKEKKEIKRRLALYRQNRPPLVLKNRIVIIADDGIATGLTMWAAVDYVFKKSPRKVIIAVPVGAQDSVQKFEKDKRIEKIICLYQPSYFGAVGAFYQMFEQIDDEEVVEIMAQS